MIRKPGYGPMEKVRAVPLQALRPGVVCLADLACEYALFHHGLFFTKGHLLRDPMSDFLAVQKRPVKAFYIDLPAKLVSGTDDIYDRRVFGVELPAWSAVLSFLGTVAALGRKQGRYWRSALQVLSCPDPLDKRDGPPSVVAIYLFGIDGHDAAWGYLPGPRGSPPMASSAPPRPDTVRLAKRLIAGENDPFQEDEQEEAAKEKEKS
ncbi:MAG: hypothetical protein E6G97_18535 [Alphaproteobacteria bacterium]|nr:MAG: hypothetical protein E6G97_18535 [Alphaproteobacteria bacterium]